MVNGLQAAWRERESLEEASRFPGDGLEGGAPQGLAATNHPGPENRFVFHLGLRGFQAPLA